MEPGREPQFFLTTVTGVSLTVSIEVSLISVGYRRTVVPIVLYTIPICIRITLESLPQRAGRRARATVSPPNVMRSRLRALVAFTIRPSVRGDLRASVAGTVSPFVWCIFWTDVA